MAMTKPAGVFLQLLSIPVMIGGCVHGASHGTAGGWIVFLLGLLLLWVGGLPARNKPTS